MLDFDIFTLYLYYIISLKKSNAICLNSYKKYVKERFFRGRRKYTPFHITETNKITDTRYVLNEQHIRKTVHLMKSKAYQHLTASGIRVLEMLSYKFYKNRWQETDFPVAQDFGVKVMGLSKNSGSTIKRGLKDLVKWGFLDKTYISPGNGELDKPNRFKFSNRWKEYN